jgi:hypothetical protein
MMQTYHQIDYQTLIEKVRPYVALNSHKCASNVGVNRRVLSSFAGAGKLSVCWRL